MTTQQNVTAASLTPRAAFLNKVGTAVFSGWLMLAMVAFPLSVVSFSAVAGGSDSGGGGSDSGGPDSGDSDSSDSDGSDSGDSGSDNGNDGSNKGNSRDSQRNNPSYSSENSDSDGSSNETPRRRSTSDEQRKAFIRNNLEAILEQVVQQSGEMIDALAEMYSLSSKEVVDRLLSDIELLTSAEKETTVTIIHGWLLRE